MTKEAFRQILKESGEEAKSIMIELEKSEKSFNKKMRAIEKGL